MYKLLMKQFSTAELVRKIGDVTHAASQAPVTVTQHGKPRFVLMSIETFEYLRGQDSRRVYRTEETPDEIAELLLSQIEAYLAKGKHDDDEAAA